jgi:hypothetical protein
MAKVSNLLRYPNFLEQFLHLALGLEQCYDVAKFPKFIRKFGLWMAFL